MKQPKANEWWQHDDCNDASHRVYMIALNSNGELLFEDIDGNVEKVSDSGWHNWHHLPDCTGWTWQPEVWPKWYVLDETKGVCEVPWYIKRTSENECLRWGLNCDGVTVGFESQTWKHQPELWIEVTEAEALTRVKPAESPDDWVEITDPNHMPRDGVDYFNGGTNDAWIVHEPRHVRSTLGEYQKSWSIGKFRCRRKDLPVMTQPKCVPVRLVCSTEDIGSVNWRMHDDPGIAGETEIKHDGYKFYVEVQQ